MKKAVLLTFVAVLLSTMAALRLTTPAGSHLEGIDPLTEIILPVHNIDSSKDYSTIQEAINDEETLDGHTIFVDKGVYYEHVVVNKSLALIGKDKKTTIIDGNKNGTVINVTVSDVLINNFAIQNSGVGWYYYGIRVEAGRCSIIGNVVSNSLWGVDLASSPHSIILGNNITNNTAPGVRISSSINVTVSGNKITNNIGTGVLVKESSNITISGNKIEQNSGDGLVLLNSMNSFVSGNNVTKNGGGIEDGFGIILSSNEVLVERNKITSNYCGLAILGGDNILKDNTLSSNFRGIYVGGNQIALNQIYHNNFVENENQVTLESSYHKLNEWDNGYPSGGNYWSDYNGVDSGHDGIGDTVYSIDESNADDYPLTGMFSDFEATLEHHVQTISNSLISGFGFSGGAVRFNVTGISGTTGFCRIQIPTLLINDTYRVFVDGTEVSSILLPFSNATHSYLYFNFNPSTQEVTIIPEFLPWTLHFILLALTVAATITKRSN